MAGKCVERLPHSCGSRSGLQVYMNDDDTYSGYCHTCGTFVKDPYGDKPSGWKPEVKVKTKEEIQQELEEIASLPFEAAADRGFDKEDLEYFGIRTGFSEQDGKTPTVRYFPYVGEEGITSYKCKLIAEKRMWTKGEHKKAHFFGWPQAIQTGARTLFITEGEEDAVALRKIMRMNAKPGYQDRNPAVVSLKAGVAHAKEEISGHLPEIKRYFQNITLVFDMDKPGREAAGEVAKVIPEVKIADLQCKDANECLKEGYIKGTFNAVMFQAAQPKNSRLVEAESLFSKAKQPATWGVSWPWQGMTDLTRGIRTGETIYLAGAEKIGKSAIANAIAAHLIKEHGWKVMMAKPEEANVRSVKALAGAMVGRIFHDPSIPFDEEAYDEACEMMKGKLVLLNLYQHIDWETLKGDIVHAAAQGAKAIFIDPITCLTNGMSASERNDALMGISQELASMALDLDVVIFIWCHLNKAPKGVTPFDRGGKVTTDYFAGSSAMARSCHYAMGIEGNKDPEIDEWNRNARKICVLADREFGETGAVNLQYDRKTGLLTESFV